MMFWSNLDVDPVLGYFSKHMRRKELIWIPNWDREFSPSLLIFSLDTKFQWTLTVIRTSFVIPGVGLQHYLFKKKRNSYKNNQLVWNSDQKRWTEIW
jgi:hypothetical protein